jgi:anaerobic selenocysteine-containing dehydrogenase
VDVNPDDAKLYGVEDGQWVWLENYQGRAQRKVHITKAVPQGLISADHGWWLPEDKNSQDYGAATRININRLLENKCGKSGFGTNFKSTVCKMYKVQ